MPRSHRCLSCSQSSPRCGARREQYLEAFHGSGRAAIARRKESGDDPTHGGSARARRAGSNVARKREASEWDQTYGKLIDLSAFEREILPAIQSVPLSRLQRATGLSLRYVSLIRRGERTPHPRRWQAFIEAGAAARRGRRHVGGLAPGRASVGDELRPASRAARSAGGSVDRLRNRAARTEGRTAAARHSARDIPEPNRVHGHYSHTRADAADSSLATVPVSSRPSCTASRGSRTGTRADAHPADLASPSVDSLTSPTGRHPGQALPQRDR